MYKAPFKRLQMVALELPVMSWSLRCNRHRESKYIMSDDQPNAEQKEYWDGHGGPVWVELQERLDAQIAPLGTVALDKAAASPGESVLDVGCGCGQTTQALAEQVGATGTVLGVDISGPMLKRAADRNRDAHNVSFVHADAQTYQFDLEKADLMFSRFGVMFFDDPTAAFSNIRRALKPGGRMCFVCWQNVEKNPWVTGPLRATAEHVPLPPPSPPGTPGPIAFADPLRLETILTNAGFQQFSCSSFESVMRMGANRGIEGAVDFLLRIGPVASLLREASPDSQKAAKNGIAKALVPFASGNHVDLDCATWIVNAVSS